MSSVLNEGNSDEDIVGTYFVFVHRGGHMQSLSTNSCDSEIKILMLKDDTWAVVFSSFTRITGYNITTYHYRIKIRIRE